MDVKLKEDEDNKPWWYYTAGTSLFFGAMFPICGMMKYFEGYEINTGSELFNTIYFRYYVNTEVFGSAQFAYYMIALVIGFAFINVVNLEFDRGTFLRGRDGQYTSIKQTILYGAICFFLSGMVVLR